MSFPADDAPLDDPTAAPMGDDPALGDDPDMLAEGDAPLPDAEPDEFPDISDETCLQVIDEAHRQSKDYREPRQTLNDRNWRAYHRKYEFISRKQAGQSKIVIPALEIAIEQICGTVSGQLVGGDSWFSADFDGPSPLPELDGDTIAKSLRRALDRLGVEGGQLPTTRNATRLIYDSLKIGMIESEVTWKVSVVDVERPIYTLDEMTGALGSQTKTKQMLSIEIVPFADYFPDPSPRRSYAIHEIEVALADLPAMGFTKEQIDKMRGNISSEKEEQRRLRAGIAGSQAAPRDRVTLREYWGDIIDPHTGELLARNIKMLACGTTYLAKRPESITRELWHGWRPFVTAELIPTTNSPVHHAFLDIAVPIVETECELTNLVVDGGFNATHGIKEVRSWMLENPAQVAKGLIPGMSLNVAEGRGDGDVVKKVDTGSLEPEVMNILDRIVKMRMDAFFVNDLQLGRFPERQESATAVTAANEASHDLFSSIAVRFEDTGIEPLIELSWLTHWQFADEDAWVGLLPDEQAQMLANLSHEERFALMANGIRIKVQGYKHTLGAFKKMQALMQLQQTVGSNPMLMAAYQQEFSPTKQFKVIYRALGIDPTELRRDPDEPYIDPAIVQGAAGNPQNGNPAADPGAASAASSATPPNATGTRGLQM